jgi:hypothetical protein
MQNCSTLTGELQAKIAGNNSEFNVSALLKIRLRMKIYKYVRGFPHYFFYQCAVDVLICFNFLILIYLTRKFKNSFLVQMVKILQLKVRLNI